LKYLLTRSLKSKEAVRKWAERMRIGGEDRVQMRSWRLALNFQTNLKRKRPLFSFLSKAADGCGSIPAKQ
jgi:hypothetical protein